MSDIKLFRTSDGTVEELKSTSVQLEKSLQTLIEQNLETFLGIRFLASEYSTGKVHGGRIDTLGIDENGCPVIIEYKRALNENVINQGLFYLEWLMDHKADFRWLVMDRIGKAQADGIQWTSPRLLCIAADFTNYDEHAVKQIPRNIALIRYRRYGDSFLLFEMISSASTHEASMTLQKIPHTTASFDSAVVRTAHSHLDYLDKVSADLRELFETLKAFLLTFGDVQMRANETYISFVRRKMVARVTLRQREQDLWINIRNDPNSVTLEPGFLAVDGQGYLTIYIKDTHDFEHARPLLIESYEIS